MQSRLATTTTTRSSYWLFSVANNLAFRRGTASGATRRTAELDGTKKVALVPPQAVEDVSCAGLDGWPWPRDKENEQRDKQEQILDDKEYYKHHKPSPLSEIEVADTRKPIRRATDVTAYADANPDVIGWRSEQLDTAEEALRRATEIWKQNAMRGDPSLPHTRVLRELRGEWF